MRVPYFGFVSSTANRGPAPPAAPAAPEQSLAPAPQPEARPVPLLLKDPVALLMHFVLLAPEHPPYIEPEHFNCIIQALYDLTYHQIVCQFIASTSAEGRAALAGGASTAGAPTGGALRQAARVLLGALAGSDLFTEDGAPHMLSGEHQHHLDIASMESELQQLLLPFLRISALLRHHLYNIPLPDILTADQEYPLLMQYCGVRGGGGGAPARAWARELAHAANRGQLVVRRILRSLHLSFSPPSLLSLPRDYDRLFTYYHSRVCLQCGAVPKEASVCLLCGTLVCLKQACCRQQQVCEAVQHAMECGGGTGIFLVVTSTYIIVIRGRRACLWGSLYLDDYDEEDRDLKRGKPLYLSQDRVDLLQAQWLAHRFDHTKRTWVWHRDSL